MTSCARCQVILGLPEGHVSTMWVKWAGHHERPSVRVNLCPRCDTELLTFLSARSPSAASIC
jgi:hypothetical protein